MGEPWYRTAFGAAYLALYRRRDLAEARLLVSSLARRGFLVPPVMDLGCGAGRHLLALAEAGVAAVGVDLSEPLLLRARDDLGRGGHARLLVRADLRALPIATRSAGTALSLFTTFGYFDEESEEGVLLAEVSRVLRPGGRLVLDFLNAARVRAEIAAATERREGEFEIEEVRALSPDGRRVVKKVRVTGAASRRELARYEERVTLFGREELTGLLAAAGLETREAWGDYDGARFEEASSPRLILVAEAR